jgi:formylglycine-generating enzyme required for sulfatase activity
MDISGNVIEWCSDWYGSDYYKDSPQKNPTGPLIGENKVVRGGNNITGLETCACPSRLLYHPINRTINQGFRLAMSV